MKLRTALLASLTLAILSVAAGAQTTHVFTNGAGSCNNSTLYHSVYCFSSPVYEIDPATGANVQTGYIGFYFKLNADGQTFTGGSVYRTDMTGSTIFTASDFQGTYTAAGFSGTFNGGAGSADEVLGLRRRCGYRGVCGMAVYLVGGSGSY